MTTIPTEYLDSSLQVGERRRYEYCPFCEQTVRGKGFVVTRTRHGYFAYCFRCHEHTTTRKGGLSPLQVRNLLTQSHTERTVSTEVVALPDDFTSEIPNIGLLWLRTYGVTDEEIHRHNFGFSPRLNRLILPVYSNGELMYWQGRKLDVNDTASPKYLNLRANRQGTFFCIFDKDEETTILVEDILSAIAVARAGFKSVALLGSFVGPDLFPVLPTKCVRVWLDPDKRKDAVKFAAKLRANGFQSSAVVLPTKDPKEYSPEEIQEILRRHKT